MKLSQIPSSRCRQYVEEHRPFSSGDLYAAWYLDAYSVRHRYFNEPLILWDSTSQRWFGDKVLRDAAARRTMRRVTPYGVEITWVDTKTISLIATYGLEKYITMKIANAAGVHAAA